MNKLISAAIFLIIYFFTGTLFSAFAQAPDTLWTKTFGGSSADRGNDIKRTSDGGYIICGETFSFGAGSSDAWLIKTNANGETEWTSAIGTASGFESANAVQQTSDGGFVFAGNIFTATSDIFLVRTDSDGDTLWTKTIGGFDSDNANDVLETEDGGFLICGETRSFHQGFGSSVFLVRTDSNGDTLWTKVYGGSSYQGGYSVSPTSDDGFIVTGSFNNGGSVSRELWLLRLNADGDTLWSKTYGGDGSHEGIAALQTPDNGYIVCGTNEFNIWLLRTDQNGDTLWTKKFEDGYIEIKKSLAIKSDGGFIITGTDFNGDMLVISTDTDGNKLWTKLIGSSGAESGSSIHQTVDGGYIICGSTDSFGAGNTDVWLVRLNPDGSTGTGNISNSLTQFELYQNYPNPFNPVTKIKFTIAEPGNVVVKIFDAVGNEIKTLADEYKSAGTYELTFNGEELSSGVYFYRVSTGYHTRTLKMLLLK